MRLEFRTVEDQYWFTDAEGRAEIGPLPGGKSAVKVCAPYASEGGSAAVVDAALPENVIRVIRVEP